MKKTKVQIKSEREIKFRYRIKDTFTDKIEFRYLNLNQIEGGLVFNNIGMKHEILSRDRFTGHYDKKGKEIYENDIVDNHVGELNHLVVYWYCCCWSLKCIRKDKGGPEYIYPHVTHPDRWDGLKIIGNTYDNPELL